MNSYVPMHRNFMDKKKKQHNISGAAKTIGKRIPITLAVIVTAGLSLWVAMGNFSNFSASEFTFGLDAEKTSAVHEDAARIAAEDVGNYSEVKSNYEETLKSTQSDIDGMTMWDKVQKGLEPENGSDTDGDGLTDKEEIETYHSDPLKASTAGDLYTDGYKVKHDMDLTKKYDYEGEQKFPGNTAEGVELEATNPLSFNAACQDLNDYYEIDGANIIKSLTLYKFEGKLRITIGQETKKKYNIRNLSDCKVYVAAWGESVMKPVDFTVTSDGKIQPDYGFSVDKTYGVVITDHAATTALFRSDKLPKAKALNGGKNGEIENVHEAFIMMLPWVPHPSQLPLSVYYVPTTDESDQQMKTNIENYYWKLADSSVKEDHDKLFHYYPVSEAEYQLRYKALRNYWPNGYNDLYKEYIGGGITSENETVAKNTSTYLLTYLDYDTICKDLGVVNGDEIKYSFISPLDKEFAFNPETNTLPFENFCTVYSQGVCAGISALTVQNWNQENLQTTASTSYSSLQPTSTDNGKIYGKQQSVDFSANVTDEKDLKHLTTKGELGKIRDSSFVSANAVDSTQYDYATDQDGNKIKNDATNSYLLTTTQTPTMITSALSKRDADLVDLITEKWAEWNKSCNVMFDNHTLSTIKPGKTEGALLVQNGKLYSWKIIEQALNDLKNGKILTLGMTGYDYYWKQSLSHCVVVYAARQDENNPNFYYFYLYDPNYPGGKTQYGLKINNVMTIIKTPDTVTGDPDQTGFRYYYAPYNSDDVPYNSHYEIVYSSEQAIADNPSDFELANGQYTFLGHEYLWTGANVVIDNETGDTTK